MKKKSILSSVFLAGTILLTGCSSQNTEDIDINDAKNGINEFYHQYATKVSSDDFSAKEVNDYIKSKMDHPSSNGYSAYVVDRINKMGTDDLNGLLQNVNKSINIDDFVDTKGMSNKEKAAFGYMLVTDSTRLSSVGINPDIKMTDDAIALTGDNEVSVHTDQGPKTFKEEKGNAKVYSDKITDGNDASIDIMNLDVIYFDKDDQGTWKIDGKETVDLMNAMNRS